MNILDTIVAQKKREVALLPPIRLTAADLQQALALLPARRDFFAPLQSPARRAPALIAEVKKASPSAGIIRTDFDPARIAREYEAAGASCLSVLTDGTFFQGSPDDLQRIRAAVKLPLLRKDFIIDERQILEAAEMGADAILLIVRILDDESLKRFHSLAAGAGLAALVEVHDEAELDRALAIGARLIGVNNRDLDTFKVDLGTTERLAARIARHPEAKDKLVVAESGIQTRADVERVQRAGAGAILVGEALLKNPAGIAAKISELLTGT
jgi:indole-3-glycerol phosphate synthase